MKDFDSISAHDLAHGLRARARSLGFGLVGITRHGPSAHGAFYRGWLESGHHGTMAYLARPDAVARRLDLAETLPSVRSVIVVGHEYHQEDPPGVPDDPSRGVIAQYARGRDYHKVVKKKLTELGQWLGGEVDGEATWRAYVDTGPILERELAVRAGLGWLGKNTMLINPKRGSYFFLGVLLTDVELPEDEPFKADHCGSCTACLDACPTDALLGRDGNGAPVLDARRCISYLTIEHRGGIPEELRTRMGNRVFGCDICQEVCPYTRKFSRPSEEPDYAPRPGLDAPSLVALADRLIRMSDDDFGEEFAGSPVRRARREGLLRNVCVALGNWGGGDAQAVLSRAVRDASTLVREHATWALRKI